MIKSLKETNLNDTASSDKMKKNLYLGVDVGSVSVKIVLMDANSNIFKGLWLLNEGSPIVSVKKGLVQLKNELIEDGVFNNIDIKAVGTTGSARYLTKSIIGGDIAKTEIIAHAVATLSEFPDVNTILEIGGQDSKIIILRHGIVSDFAMNSVCAAGTGSFLDHQAQRLKIPIEQFGPLALRSTTYVPIAGRCTVFAETDMIHRQQMGHTKEDIIWGLCNSLVRNYLNNVGKGKVIKSPVVFQGGVAANIGIVQAFKEQLNVEINVPKNYILMGAIGAALLAKEFKDKKIHSTGSFKTNFRGFELIDMDFKTTTFRCEDCPNQCEIVQITLNNGNNLEIESEVIACWGSRCGKRDI
jgi:predicted CoA-substrate-specific enzyme activase